MTDIGFYHLTQSPLEKTLPKLLEKILGAGHRVIVQASSPERVEALNGVLWTYHPQSFLPHGTAKTGRPADQPIWLTCISENPNGANILALVDGAQSEQLVTFDRVVYLFDGNDPQALAQARTNWKTYGDQGHTVVYWQQTDAGGWVQKG